MKLEGRFQSRYVSGSWQCQAPSSLCLSLVIASSPKHPHQHWHCLLGEGVGAVAMLFFVGVHTSFAYRNHNCLRGKTGKVNICVLLSTSSVSRLLCPPLLHSLLTLWVPASFLSLLRLFDDELSSFSQGPETVTVNSHPHGLPFNSSLRFYSTALAPRFLAYICSCKWLHPKLAFYPIWLFSLFTPLRSPPSSYSQLSPCTLRTHLHHTWCGLIQLLLTMAPDSYRTSVTATNMFPLVLSPTFPRIFRS